MHNIYTGNTKNIYLPCHVIRYTDTRGYDLPIITVKTHWKAHNFFFHFHRVSVSVLNNSNENMLACTFVHLAHYRSSRFVSSSSLLLLSVNGHFHMLSTCCANIYIYIHELCVKLGPLCYCCHSMVCILYINDDNNSAASHNLHL